MKKITGWSLASLVLIWVLVLSFGSNNFVSAQESEATLTTETPIVEVVEIVEITEVAAAEEVPTTVETEAPAPETQIVASVVSTPVLSTDKDDYHPGETASIFGRLFTSFSNIVLKIFGSDENEENYVESVQEVAADESGSFTATYELDSLYRPFYEVFALDLSGNILAQTWFRDSSVGAYDQCSNDDGDGYTTGNTGCRWITGAIGQNNSVYFEGDSTPQRVWLEGFAPNTSHTVTFKYGTTKGGKHAYDYLTSWNASENWIATPDQCENITGCTSVAETTVGMENDPNVVDAIELALGSRLFTIRGGTITNVSAPAIDTGTYAGDSETIVTVTFTTAASGSMCSTKRVQGQDVTTCGVAIWFGAHIANSDEWFAENGGSGAGSINGNPYHVALAAVDSDSTSGGGRDNQMSAAVLVIPTKATLTLLKTVVNDNGGTAQDTDWTLSANGPTPISGTENQAPITGALVDAGQYTLSESAGPVGYSASLYSCVVNDGSPVVNNSLTLAPDDIAVCTITNNDIAPSLTLVKQVVNSNGGTGVPANWTLSATGYDSASPDAGTYNLSESGGPAGYTQTSLTCSDTGSTQVTSVTLSLDEDVTCTFVNTSQPGHLIVHKVTNPASDTTTQFSITASGGTIVSPVATQTIAGGGSVDYTVHAGTYDVTEQALAGWSQTSNTCVDVEVSNGETEHCTITNVKKGTITIVKNAVPDNAQDFSFTGDLGAFTLDNDGNNANDLSDRKSFNVAPGTYAVSETSAAGWKLFGATCNDGSPVSAINLAPGEDVICTFENHKLATIVLVKHALGTDGTFDFTMTGNSLDSSAQLTTIGGWATSTFSNIDPDNSYSVLENALPNGWVATQVSCVQSNGTVKNNTAFTIANGATVTCTFTNAKLPTLELRKTVVNDNGGTATAANFQGKVNGQNIAWSTATTTVPGSYTASETTAVNGYAPSVWSTDCAADGSVTLAYGDNKVCSITNDDIAPSLTLVKEVTNDNGGTAVASDWTLVATDYDSVSPDAGTYNLSESGGPSGYTQTSLTCSNTGIAPVTSVTLSLDEDVTCTFVNDDVAPTLTLVKTVINDNGGQKLVSDFPLFIDVTPVISGATSTLAAGVQYTASETSQAGYSASSWGGNCASDGTITLSVGEVATCTITNDDIAPTLTIVKDATPNDLQNFVFDGTLGAFTLDDDSGVSEADDVYSNSKTFTNVEANINYTVTETLPNPFWSFEGVSCVINGSETSYPFTSIANGLTVNLGLDQDVTCTISNLKESPTRTQGFWQTHTSYTSGVFASKFAGGMVIGTSTHQRIVTNIPGISMSKLFGSYFSSIAKKTDGKQRSNVEKARMQLLQQLVTAKLNCAEFGCSSAIKAQITAADLAYAGTNVSTILTSAALMDAYNNSGDTMTISPAGKATPQTSKTWADMVFWNLP